MQIHLLLQIVAKKVGLISLTLHLWTETWQVFFLEDRGDSDQEMEALKNTVVMMSVL